MEGHQETGITPAPLIVISADPDIRCCYTVGFNRDQDQHDRCLRIAIRLPDRD